MARMYPTPISSDTMSPAERLLYELLRDRLDHSFVVLHSVAWIAKNLGAGARDGEADFVIAHPQHGVLVVEAKGGEILLDSDTQQWYTVNKKGTQIEIRDPFKQSTDSAYNLRRKLSDSAPTRPFEYSPCHAVAFPDVGLSSSLRPDAPRDIIIDKTRLSTLQNTILGIFEYWRGQVGGNPKPGIAGIEAFVKVLAPTWHLRSLLAHYIEDEDKQIKQLTQNQFNILNMLSRRRRAAIVGGAGTGKTMIAIEKACRLAAEGFSVLFVCYNRNLADWLSQLAQIDERIGKEALKQEKVVVTTFHGLCGKAVQWAKLPMPTGPRDQNFYDEILPDLLVQAVDKMDRRFDAVIVDEGQDIDKDWWISLEALLKSDQEGIFYVFFDDNQDIYQRMETIPVEEEPFYLDTNCRNTRQIHAALTPYSHSAYRTNCDGCPEGRQIQIVTSDVNTSREALKHTLLRLVNEQDISPSDIIILTPHSVNTSAWQEGDRLGTLTLSWSLDSKLTNTVRVSSIYGFKGLESRIVILTEMEKELSDELVYVAMSRARNELIVIGNLSEPHNAAD